MKLNFAPIGINILVKPEEQKEQKTMSGIVLVERNNKPQTGYVVAAGAGRILENGEVRPLTVKVGDKIVFPMYAGATEIELEGELYLLMKETDIHGIIAKN